MSEAETDHPLVNEGVQYALDVLDGTIPACSYVRAACQRFIDDLERAEDEASPWEFRPELAERCMRFIGLLPHIKGPKAGQPITLSPWQSFIISNLMGWVERSTGARRFRQAIIYVPRGSGKSTLCSGLGLYLSFFEGEGGAESYAAAVSRDQAKIVWQSAKEMLSRTPRLAAGSGIDIRAHTIIQPKTASKFVAISSEARALDGLNVHFAVLDEIASHPTSEVFDSLVTACGKRRNPLLMCISTATGNHAGIGKVLWDYVVKVLEGHVEDDRVFGVLYTIDKDDDPWDEASWIKASPAWGVSVQPDAIRAVFTQARNSPAMMQAAFTRNLNVWSNADNALFNTRAWAECEDPDLRIEDFRGRACHVGVDLASRQDLASVAVVFPTVAEDGEIKYAVFQRSFLNEFAISESPTTSFAQWIKEGHLIQTPDNETDLTEIEAEIRRLCKEYKVISVAYDPWSASYLAQRLLADRIPVVEFPMNVRNFSPPTKELESAMIAGRIRHNGDGLLAWCIANVVGYVDQNGNTRPNRSKTDRHAKIDAAVAMIMAIGRCMVQPAVRRSVYETRGPLIVG